MWKTIDSTESVVLIINRAVPYYISGVAVAIGFKMNLFNIGSNGQYLLAALIAGWAGAEVSLPPVLHILVHLPRRHHGRRALGADRRDPERHTQRQRRRLDDHAQLHRDRHQRVPAGRGLPRRRARRTRRADEADPRVRPDPVAQPALRARRLQLRARRRPVRLPPVRNRARHRLLPAAEPEPVRVRPSPLGDERRGRTDRRRQSEADGVDHDVPVGWRRRHDRAPVPAGRPELPQVR